MTPRDRASADPRVLLLSLTLGVFATGTGLEAAGDDKGTAGMDHSKMDHGQMDHSKMDHGQMDHGDHVMDTTRDALGRRLWGQQHQMSPAMYDELREKIPVYRNATKAVIDMSMVQMGPEYQWYISPASLKNDAGVLVMTHGFREQGDALFKEQLSPLASTLPTSLSLGMAMMMSDHVQLSVDDLEAAGARRIVVVPLVSTPHNELKRQWDYIFGLQDKPEFATVPQVTHKAEILMADPPGDDPMIAEILVDFAREISTDPAKELVIIVAHGASGADSAADSVKEMKVLETLGRYVREDGGFADVQAALLQDDAPLEVREANVRRLRAMVEGASKKGQSVLIVTNLLGARTIQPKLRSDLKGLEYRFNSKGITQHPNFIEWLGESVRMALEKAG